jgi:di/tricarboxylate transporter
MPEPNCRSRIVLVCAYFISITYYLQLLAAFMLNAFHVQSQVLADVITTVLLLTIGGIGMWRGLKELGAVEKYAVALVGHRLSRYAGAIRLADRGAGF